MANYSASQSTTERNQFSTHRAGDSLDPISSDVNLEQSNEPETAVLAKELAEAWLTWQCQMVAGIIRAAVFLPNQIAPKCALAVWPKNGNCEAQLVAVANRALQKMGSEKFSKIGYGPDQKRLCDLVACPIFLHGSPIAYVAVAISIRSEPQQHAVLQLLRWGGLWVETLVQERLTLNRKTSTFPQKIMPRILAQTTSKAVAIEATNLLSKQYSCDRVSIGFYRGSSVKLEAISHVKRFDSRTQLVRTIENAMEEAVDQNSTIKEPDQCAESLTRNRKAHTELKEKHAKGAVCTMPLRGLAGVLGAITFERPANLVFEKQTELALDIVVRQIGLIVELKQKNELSWWHQSINALLDSASSIIGPKYLQLKFLSLGVIVLLLTASLNHGTYDVRSPASIEGTVRQILVAPQHGYIKEALVRAGDNVVQGQILAILDDKSLQLELQKWRSERDQTEKKYQKALASGDRTDAGIYKARLDRFEAEIQQTSNALEQTQIKAPFDGIVVSGDLSQSLGAPIEIGQLMFEVAPLKTYRVVLEVDESNINGLTVGKTGHLIVAALPHSTFEFSVDQIVPLAVTGTPNTYFRVEAILKNPSDHLRPGMRGIAKVEVGEQNLLWIWTHTLLDKLRLWSWSVGF